MKSTCSSNLNLARQCLFWLLTLGLFVSGSDRLFADDAPEGRFLGAMDTDYPDWFKQSFLDINEDIAEAAQNHKRVMILFYQDGCPYCNALVERNLSQKSIESKLREHFDVIAINMWGDREVTASDGEQYTEKEFARALRVQFTPTLIFLDEQGDAVLRLNGYRPPHRFSIDLDYVIHRQEHNRNYRDYVQAHLPPTSPASQLIAEPYLRTGDIDLAKGRDASRPFAVFFEQRDCPACEELHQLILPASELQKDMAGFELFQLDMWAPSLLVTPDGRRISRREWARELDIKYAPSIVLFNPQGKEVIRMEAFFKVFHTRGVFRYVSSQAYQQQPSFQRFLSDYADSLRRQGQDVDIWRFSTDPAKTNP